MGRRVLLHPAHHSGPVPPLVPLLQQVPLVQANLALLMVLEVLLLPPVQEVQRGQPLLLLQQVPRVRANLALPSLPLALPPQQALGHLADQLILEGLLLQRALKVRQVQWLPLHP